MWIRELPEDDIRKKAFKAAVDMVSNVGPGFNKACEEAAGDSEGALRIKPMLDQASREWPCLHRANLASATVVCYSYLLGYAHVKVEA